ncbi:kin of IRRE-like protein 1 isoform X2 [Lingula anatina]|uniref:Kin of IRRE-like protein 1 isoform X2 n=1 Tax=Lingula anatina TaxID=7574 RepID=A0A1S3H511_LINAN|nr:kin of IRRE-like protein 1 isoform X2 [Lingula anatina]|eukprot:XP_013380224.1 kin of IRRE-like protein 1 isoform X2 [Lingula anatina]
MQYNMEKAIIRKLLHLMAGLALAGTVYCQQGFVVQPEDQQVKQGDTVIMKCKVENREGQVQWTRGGFGLGTDRSLIGFERYSMLGDENNGVYDLMIVEAELQDDDVYQCQIGATHTTPGVRSRSAQLTVLLPPNFPIIYGSPVVNVEEGQPYNLTCRANNGKPAPTLKWFVEGAEVTDNVSYEAITQADGKRQDAISYLTITPSKTDQGKRYSCQAMNAFLTDPLTTSASLEVLYAPEVTITASPKLGVKEGESIQFSCEGRGNPNNITWKWYRNNEEIGDADSKYLRVDSLTADHDGNIITCEAINSVGSTKKNYQMAVEYGPRFTVPIKHAAAQLGETATLTCKTKGNPTPRVVWKKKGSQRILSSSDTLTISRVTESDLGIYICYSNVIGFSEINRELHLLKKGPPKVISNEEQYAKEGDIATLECLTESVPKPDQIRWARQEQDLLQFGDSARYKVEEEDLPTGRKSILTIVNVHSGDYGDYNCSVKNTYGTDALVIKLKQKDAIPLAFVMGGVFGGLGLILIIAIIIFIYQRTKSREEASTSDTDSADSATKKPEIKVEYKNPDYNGPLEPWRNDYNKDHYSRYSAEYDELNVNYKPNGRPYPNGYGFPPTYPEAYKYLDDVDKGAGHPYDRLGSYDSGFEPDYHPRNPAYGRPPPPHSMDPRNYPEELYPEGTISRLSTNV